MAPAEMASRGGAPRAMVQPISLVFRYLQGGARVSVWLYDNAESRIEGVIRGFDEYMNLVLDDAAEVDLRSGARAAHGRILLKGDAITLVTDGGLSAPGDALGAKRSASPETDSGAKRAHVESGEVKVDVKGSDSDNDTGETGSAHAPEEQSGVQTVQPEISNETGETEPAHAPEEPHVAETDRPEMSNETGETEAAHVPEEQSVTETEQPRGAEKEGVEARESREFEVITEDALVGAKREHLSGAEDAEPPAKRADDAPAETPRRASRVRSRTPSPRKAAAKDTDARDEPEAEEQNEAAAPAERPPPRPRRRSAASASDSERRTTPRRSARRH